MSSQDSDYTTDTEGSLIDFIEHDTDTDTDTERCMSDTDTSRVSTPSVIAKWQVNP